MAFLALVASRVKLRFDLANPVSVNVMLQRIHVAGGGIIAMISVAFTGCQLEPPSILNPGDLQYQRARANRYDPFPDNQAGPAVPEMRPRDFSTPPPEPSRARWQNAAPR